MNLGTQSIVRRGRSTSTTEDEYGNPVPDPPGPDLTITGCSVQPGAGPEFNDRREATTTIWTVWAPIESDVVDTDTVAYKGIDYAVDGQVERWEVGTALDHLVIRLTKVTG